MNQAELFPEEIKQIAEARREVKMAQWSPSSFNCYWGPRPDPITNKTEHLEEIAMIRCPDCGSIRCPVCANYCWCGLEVPKVPKQKPVANL